MGTVSRRRWPSHGMISSNWYTNAIPFRDSEEHKLLIRKYGSEKRDQPRGQQVLHWEVNLRNPTYADDRATSVRRSPLTLKPREDISRSPRQVVGDPKKRLRCSYITQHNQFEQDRNHNAKTYELLVIPGQPKNVWYIVTFLHCKLLNSFAKSCTKFPLNVDSHVTSAGFFGVFLIFADQFLKT